MKVLSKKRVKQLEKRRKSRTSRLKRLMKVGSASKVESSNDVSLGAQEDASKQGRKIADLDSDEEVTLIDETHERNDEEMFFDVQDDLQGEEVVAEKQVVEKELVLADTSYYCLSKRLLLSNALDEELAHNWHAEEQAKMEANERVAQEEASRVAIIEKLDNIQAMIEADEQLAARLQAEEQEQFSIKEKSRMLVEMIAERKKFFVAQRAAEQRSKPPTKTQIRNRMCAYLKNMGGYKHNQLKGRSYEEIQKLFDKAYKQVNSFVPMDSEVVKSSETRTEGSSKRAGDELESDKSKKQKIDEHVEAEKDDDQEEAEMKRHIEIVKDDEYN
ncbi:hypothetical protein Tco_0352228 [Tanacetum coccineum]